MKPHFFLATLSLGLLVGCQVAFGDFTIDTSHLGVSCEAGTARCEGSQVQACVGGSEWRTLATCDSPELCNLLTFSCAPCRPGAYQCNAAQPQVCDAEQRWSASTPAPCASAALCAVPNDGSPATCLPAGCPATCP